MCYQLKKAINSRKKNGENTWKCFNFLVLLTGYISAMCSHARYKINMQMSPCPENNALEINFFLTRKHSVHQR